MSYTVGLSLGTVNPDDALAFREFEQLHAAAEAGGVPHPTFVEIHAELTARFPCICDLADEDVDDGVWSDGPLINNFGERTAVVGCVFSAAHELVPFLYEVAGRHGATVFDWQTGGVVRPDADPKPR